MQNSNLAPDFFSNKVFVGQLKQSLWRVGVAAWLFALFDRGLAIFAEGSSHEAAGFLMILLLLVSWLSLKPTDSLERPGQLLAALPIEPQPSSSDIAITQARMAALQDYHLITQAYRLPFPYLCQIYHLLNLKHLETVHSFSLNNLKVLAVSYTEATDYGGVVKFKTVLGSPFNLLRIWRQTSAEAKLTLHNRYTVELGIPVYGDKAIVVLFNAIPLSQTEHQFSINIYSNLNWYKPLLKPVLHFASLLTLIEDLPYLQALTQRNLQKLVKLEKPTEMMWLMSRFASLRKRSLEADQTSESQP